MVQRRFDYVDNELNHEIEELIKSVESMRGLVEERINSVSFFLKREQFNITVGTATAATAEVVMKGMSAFFVERKKLLDSVVPDIDESIANINTFITRLEHGGHLSKVTRLKDLRDQLDSSKVVVEQLKKELTEAKAKQLEDLKVKILKAERHSHFKNLR